LVIETLGIFRFVSIPSRRVGDSAKPSLVFVQKRFHPLKAGRRPSGGGESGIGGKWFPSPQGGSET
jgi:hypothetical protein